MKYHTYHADISLWKFVFFISFSYFLKHSFFICIVKTYMEKNKCISVVPE